MILLRCKQVYIGWSEATLLSVYLPEAKRTSIYVRSTFLASLLPCYLGLAQLNPSATPVFLSPEWISHARCGALTLHSAVAHHRLPARAAGGGADFKNVPVCLIKPPSNVWSAGRCRCTPRCTSTEHCLNCPRPLHLFNDRDWSSLPGVRRDQPLVFSAFPRS